MKKAFDIFKSKFSSIFILSLMIVLPVYLIQEFLLMPYAPEAPDTEAMDYNFDSKMLWYFAGVLLVTLFIELYKIGVIKLSYEALESRQINISEIMDFSMRIWPKTVLTTIIYSIFVAFGFMLFFIPGMMMFVLYYLYVQVIVITGIWGRGALMISSLYTRKNLNKIITISLIGIASPYCFTLLSSVIQNFIPHKIASALVAVLITFIGQFVITYLDIFATVCVHETKLDINIDMFKKKKDDNVQH